MKGKTLSLWAVGSATIAAMAVAVVLAGCGGGKASRPASSGIHSGRMGEMVLTIDWGSKSRVIPP